MRSERRFGEDAGLLVRVVVPALGRMECAAQVAARVRVRIEGTLRRPEQRGAGGRVDRSAWRLLRLLCGGGGFTAWTSPRLGSWRGGDGARRRPFDDRYRGRGGRGGLEGIGLGERIEHLPFGERLEWIESRSSRSAWGVAEGGRVAELELLGAREDRLVRMRRLGPARGGRCVVEILGGRQVVVGQLGGGSIGPDAREHLAKATARGARPRSLRASAEQLARDRRNDGRPGFLFFHSRGGGGLRAVGLSLRGARRARAPGGR